MPTCFLTSAFDNGFTKDFSDELLKRYKKGYLAFVASDFEGHQITDKYVKVFVNMFHNAGIVFDEVIVIDSRLLKEEAHKAVREASIVWLAGGDTLLQMRNIDEYELSEPLHQNPNIVIGMSAGSINMAEDVVLARDESDNVLTLSKYKGIGLTQLNIEPHLNLRDQTSLQDVYEASKHSTIYGLYDEAFILVENEITLHGNCTIFENGKIVKQSKF